MLCPHNLLKLVSCALLFGIALTTGNRVPVLAQLPDDERERGILLYKKGEYQEASKVLRAAAKNRKDDVSVWHYLGLTLESLGQGSEARKEHEKAAKLGDSLLTASLSQAENGDYVARLRRIAPQLLHGAESAEKYVKLSSKLSRSRLEEWTDRAASLRDFAELSLNKDLDKDLRHIYLGTEVTTKARILAKEEPQYTEEARQRRVTGRVVLRLILVADGTVRGIVPIRSLPSGLTGSSIKVARKIRFIPATKDGKPVSMLVQVEYDFYIY